MPHPGPAARADAHPANNGSRGGTTQKGTAVDIDDIMGKAKEALANVSDEQIDSVAKQVKDKTPDQVDPAVDEAANFLKGQN